MAADDSRSRRDVLLGAAAAGASAILPGCADYVKVDGRGWSTASGIEYVVPRWRWAPANVAELVGAVARAEREGHRVRMTGSGHSFSDVAIGDDWLLDPKELSFELPLDASSVRPNVNAKQLFRVSSGARISCLNAALIDNGLALRNMGGAEVQTVVGAASTGTHGSGLKFGPIASQIASIQVVGPGGRLMQVEPSGGITDPTKFAGVLPEDPAHPVALRQDDDLFRALAINLGSLGIIYSVVLETVPMYWVVERRILTSWEDLIGPDGDGAKGVLARFLAGRPVKPPLPAAPSGLDPGSFAADPDHLDVFYSPYEDDRGRHPAVLTVRWRTETKPPGTGGVRGSCLFTVEQSVTKLADQLGIDRAIEQGASLTAIKRLHANMLSGLTQDYYANVYNKVFNTGVVNDLNLYGIEMSFDMSQTKEATERSFSLSKELAARRVYNTGPISLRFVAPFRGHIAMQNREGPTMHMEVGVMTGLVGSEELLRSYEAVMISEFRSRPHWGLDRNALRSEREVAALYPAWSKWKRAYLEMNPKGTFDGAVTDRLGISRTR